MLRQGGVFSYCLVVLLIARVAWSQETPPASLPTPSSAPSSSVKTVSPISPVEKKVTSKPSNRSDDALLQELSQASAADAEALKRAKGADAGQAESRHREDPLRMLLGKEAVGNEMNPSLSPILDFVGAYFSRQDRFPLSGEAPTSTGLAVTGAEFAASANIDPYFKFDMAFNFTHMELEEITLTSLSLPWNFQIRAGQFLSKLGRHNPMHPHQWHVVLYPLPNQYLFSAEGLTAPGVEISWLSPLPWYLEVIGALQMGEGGSFKTKPLSEGDPAFEDFLYPLRLVQFFDLSDDWALRVGLNALLAPSAVGPETGNRAFTVGTDLFVKWRPIGMGKTGYTTIAWLTELWYREMQVVGQTWKDLGGYMDLLVGISKRWEAVARGELWRRVGGEDPSTENGRKDHGLNTERLSLAVSFMPSHFSHLRLQYTLEHVEGFYRNHIGLAQIEVSAGAHGAHTY